MRFAQWLVALLTLGYAVGAVHYYVCTVKQVYCYDTPVPTATTRAAASLPTLAPTDTRPVVFGYGLAQPRYNTAHWPAYRDSVLAALPEGQTLEITGLYYDGEPAPRRAVNMGMARAAALRQHLGERLPDERILLSARRLPAPQTALPNWYRLTEFNYLAAEGKAEVIELPDRIVVYFPPAKTEGSVDPTISAYLDRLAEQLELTEQRVRITGHTDTDGPAAVNLQLGQARADAVAALLRQRRIAPQRLEVESQGETDPAAANDTPLGKQRNRRVEIQLLD